MAPGGESLSGRGRLERSVLDRSLEVSAAFMRGFSDRQIDLESGVIGLSDRTHLRRRFRAG